MRFRETSASEPSMRCRKEKDDVRTGGLRGLQDKSKRSLFTAWAASGIKMARTWTRLWCGTWEPVVPMLREKLKWVDPIRVTVPMRGTGTDQLVLAGKSL